MTLDRARDVKMELITKSGKTIVLKPKISLLDREVIDSMFMSKKALLAFYEKEIEDARKTGVMFSLHVKATMMKVSHPIVFGHCVKIFYREAFEKHGALFKEPRHQRQQRHDRPLHQDRIAAAEQSRTKSSVICMLAMSIVRAGDGRLGQGHHQLPLAERRHR